MGENNEKGSAAKKVWDVLIYKLYDKQSSYFVSLRDIFSIKIDLSFRKTRMFYY
jgi:hypothetical protein